MNLSRFFRKKRSGASSIVIAVAMDLILWATVGFVGLQLLATAGTTSFQTVVVLISITVVSIIASVATLAGFLRRAGIHI